MKNTELRKYRAGYMYVYSPLSPSFSLCAFIYAWVPKFTCVYVYIYAYIRVCAHVCVYSFFVYFQK